MMGSLGHLAPVQALEHMVDAVVRLEGDAEQSYRLMRSTKNRCAHEGISWHFPAAPQRPCRYGTTDEVGIFSMDPGGLHAVDNPSAQVG